MSLNHAEKLRLLSDLIRMAGADGEHRDEEYDFLHRITKKLSIDPMEMEMLFTKPSNAPWPKSEKQRILIFHHLILMITVDHEVALDEIILLKAFGLKLGLRPQAVNEVIKRLDDYLGTGFPAEELIDIFQVHHN